MRDVAAHTHTRRPEPRFHARQEDIARWHEAARCAGARAFASWARDALDAAAASGTTAADLRAELVNLRTEVNRLGNNLNQATKALNTLAATGHRGAALPVPNLAAMERDIAAIRRTIEGFHRKLGGPFVHRRRPVDASGLPDLTNGNPRDDEVLLDNDGLPTGIVGAAP